MKGQMTNDDRMFLLAAVNSVYVSDESRDIAVSLIKDEVARLATSSKVPSDKISLKTSVCELGLLGVRARITLERLKVTTIEELLQKTQWDILQTRGAGRATLSEILLCLRSYGLNLAHGQEL
jgi:DNA-directed RNA polymerase alpha subunit